MAEDLNQEPTAEEKAKFEQDVLKAAEEAMKMEAEANQDERRETKDESASEEKNAEERHCEEQGDEAIQKEASTESAEQPAERCRRPDRNPQGRTRCRQRPQPPPDGRIRQLPPP